jgi:hypothetical protein
MVQLLIWVLAIGAGVYLLKLLINVIPWIDADFKKIAIVIATVVAIIWALSLIAAFFGYSLWPDPPWHAAPHHR